MGNVGKWPRMDKDRCTLSKRPYAPHISSTASYHSQLHEGLGIVAFHTSSVWRRLGLMASFISTARAPLTPCSASWITHTHNTASWNI